MVEVAVVAVVAVVRGIRGSQVLVSEELVAGLAATGEDTSCVKVLLRLRLSREREAGMSGDEEGEDGAELLLEKSEGRGEDGDEDGL